MKEETATEKIKRLESEVEYWKKEWSDLLNKNTRAEKTADAWENVAGNLSEYLRTLGT